MDDYEEEFLADSEGKRRLCVKRLTRAVEVEFRRMTVNAPDWWVGPSCLARLCLTYATVGIQLLLRKWRDNFCGTGMKDWP